MTRYKDAKWLREQYIEKDRTQAEMARICGCCQVTIGNWLEKFDITKANTAQFGIQTDEYEQWKCEAGPGKADTVLVHRLLATLQIDELDELEGKHVHHESEIPWDNRLNNLEVVTPQEHGEIHADDGSAETAV